MWSHPKDGWTYDGADQNYYQSPIASYLALTIRAISDKTTFPPLTRSSEQISSNLRLIDEWLQNVENAHRPTDKPEQVFPVAQNILDKLGEIPIWSYERNALAEIIRDNVDDSALRDKLQSLVQLLAFTHFLLDRCCFTVIEPSSDEWAFDMFQSLNATGTPLTAIETFKAMVVNAVDDNGGTFKGSLVETYFEQIEKLFAGIKKAEDKTKKTNEYMTTLSHSYDGNKLARRFSQQRKWLIDQFSPQNVRDTPEEFVRKMANVATYLDVVNRFDHEDEMCLNLLHGPLGSLATTCVLYLNDSNHVMSHALLSRFYGYLIRQEDNSEKEFIQASKAIAAFYTLWRAVRTNTGLDDVYRKILRGDLDNEIEPFGWVGKKEEFTSSKLKQRLLTALSERKIGVKADWMRAAKTNLRIDSAGQHVVRFCLLLIAEHTIPDQHNGLMKRARGPRNQFITPAVWRKRKETTVEHIAPKTRQPNSSWDAALYDENRYENIGNLTLLPDNVNTSAGNRNWKSKYIYYSYLAQQDPNKLDQLNQLAKAQQVELSDSTLELLRQTPHNPMIESLITFDMNGSWNWNQVEKRAERICDILWDVLITWLQ
jgi:hypothetical protein